MVLALTSAHMAILVIAAAIFIAAAVSDARSYRIPNSLCLSLLLLFPAFVVTAPEPVHWQQNLGVFALAAAIGFAMFYCNVTGAGDVKLLSVASLWAGPHLIAVLLIVTAFSGGIESIIMAAVTYRRFRAMKKKPQVIKVPIPYGIAIAAGGLTMLGMMAQPILLPE